METLQNIRGIFVTYIIYADDISAIATTLSLLLKYCLRFGTNVSFFSSSALWSADLRPSLPVRVFPGHPEEGGEEDQVPNPQEAD